MASMQMSGQDLLQAVKQLDPEQFDAFIEQAISLRAQPRAATLSGVETRLIQRINRGLPEKLRSRCAQLRLKRKKGTLTRDEHVELLTLTHEAESQDADRAAALLELAQLRRIPIRTLMKQFGIKARPIHG